MDEDEDNDDKYDEDDENGSEGEDSPVERDYGEDASAPPCSKNNNDNPQPVAIAEPVLPVRGIYQSGEISLARVFQSRKTKLRGGDSVLYWYD